MRLKYTVLVLCQAFKISPRTYYHSKNTKKYQPKSSALTYLEKLVIKIFKENRQIYGCRKISIYLKKYYRLFISKNTVSKIMRKHSLISVYNLFCTKRLGRSKVNQSSVDNILNQRFSNWNLREANVSDLTYIRIDYKWLYLYVITDLANREIIGHRISSRKEAQLVKQTFMSIKDCDLRKVKIFHTDRGSEFDNEIIEQVLSSFGIDRSLSKKGYPYDNAVAENIFKTIKTELINQTNFMKIRH